MGQKEPLSQKVENSTSNGTSDTAKSAKKLLSKNFINWDVQEVKEWVRKLNPEFEKYVSNFEHNKINGAILLYLTEKDLQNILDIKDFWAKKTIYIEIQKLRKFQERQPLSIFNGDESKEVNNWTHGDTESFSKAVAAFFYILSVAFVTAFTMTEVETRVPNQMQYPPLPDIVLDTFEKIPEAFMITEFIILFYFFLFFLLLLIHKHRLVVLKRLWVISGSVFALRCITMYVTSLSVPDMHMKCDIHGHLSTEEKLWRAVQIISGGALSINGVRTCGDYMFSGHASVLTLLNHFLTEYTPLNWKGFAVFTWTLNIIGMFGILIAHEHYSIDVLIAFFISSRLFAFYHSLCNSSHLLGATHERARSAWPLFSYWEEYTDDIVPNEDIFGLFV